MPFGPIAKSLIANLVIDMMQKRKNASQLSPGRSSYLSRRGSVMYAGGDEEPGE